MRAREFITEHIDRAPEVTLCGLNRRNRVEKERETWRKRHRALARIMYADPDWELKKSNLK